MLTGKELGRAIEIAIKRKGISKAAVARHFGVKPPSVSDWINRGTIDKGKLDELFTFFSSVVTPAHWGISTSSDKHWPTRHAISEPNQPHHRRLIQQVIDIAEQIDDPGLRELASFAKYIQAAHPLDKAKHA